MPKYVLLEPIASKKRGQKCWLAGAPGRGPSPKVTTNPKERHEFATRKEAATSYVHGHLLTIWNIEEVPDAEEETNT